MSSGKGSKLVNLFFLPNESGSMRTLNYWRRCVPAHSCFSLCTRTHPPFLRLQMSRPHTNPYFCWLPTKMSLSKRKPPLPPVWQIPCSFCVFPRRSFLSIRLTLTCSLCARQCSGCFTCFNSFIFFTSLWGIITLPLHRWRYWGSKRLSNPPWKVKKPRYKPRNVVEGVCFLTIFYPRCTSS